MKTSEPSYYAYLSYVTLSEAWAEAKTQFGVWLVLSFFVVVMGSLGLIGSEAVQSRIGFEVPAWIQWVAVLCAMFWFMRGEELKFRFPKFTFLQWLLSSLVMLSLGWAIATLPLWASAPFWLAIVVGAGAVDELCAKGRENYSKLQPQLALDEQDSSY